MIKNEFAMPAETKPDFTRVDENKISVRMVPITADPVEIMYDCDVLQKERATIIVEANKYFNEQQARLDSIDAILTQCKLLEIKSRVENGQLERLS